MLFPYVPLTYSVDSALVEYKISGQVHDQFQAFISGFNDLISHEAINVLDERELEVCRSLLHY
jgi:HECT-domain (ubiquitin-transferase)